MNIKVILTCITWSIALACLPAGRAAEKRPNFVLIFIDDLGYGDIGPFNPECKNRTPHLDQMAREGMKLTSFYAAPVCTPSRAQVLTGCYAKRVSLPNVLFPGANIGLHPDEQTLAELLKGQGYATMCIGKWHLGDQPACFPTKHGFDHYFGVPYSNDMQFRQGSAQGKLALVRDDKLAELLANDEQASLTARYTDEAIRFIREHEAKPFFLYLPHSAVHVPLHPSEKFAGQSKNGPFGDWVEEVDASVGRVLETLRELKLGDKTMVVFTSDNGPWLSQGKNGGVAGPLRGGKGGTFEGGVREPTIAWWPGRIEADSTSDAVAGNIDFLPTFVSLAGGAVPKGRKIDGRDISPLLLGRTKESPHDAWYYFWGTQLQAVRSGPWKLATAPQNERRVQRQDEVQVSFKPTLYNLDEDIGETNNVIREHPEVVARLQALVAKMDADLGISAAGPGVRAPARFENALPLVADAASPPAVAKPLSELKLGESVRTAAAPQIAGQPFRITCEVEPKSPGGVIVAHGGTAVGYALHLADGKPCFTVKIASTPVTISAEKAAAGRYKLNAELAPDGAMTLKVSGEVVARGRSGGLIPKQPQEDLSVGFDAQQPLTKYAADPKYRGTVERLQIATTTDEEPESREFAQTALAPFWRSKRLPEPLFFIQSEASARPQATLLFKPDKVLRVTSATRETTYELGRDYVVDEARRIVSLPEGSRIPFKTLDQLYPLMTSDAPKIARQQGDKTRGVFFDNAAGYHKLQIEVTYDFAPGQWKGYVPQFAGKALPRTIEKLRAKQPLKLRLCGDSISEGYNASKFSKAKPGCPAYGELTALAIESHFGSRVDFKNYAVSGWNAARGLKQVLDDNVGKQQPDLVIVAFGMNDVFARDAAGYQKNIRGMLEAIRKASPGAEFILVASMLGNAQWGMPMEQFPLYRDALQELRGEGVAIVDMTAMWEELLKHKSFYDLTGNGVNHPNDFGHGVYAQAILALLVE